MQKKKVNVKTYKRYSLWTILTLYGGCSLCYLLNLMTSGSLFSQSALAVPLFAFVAFLLALFYNDLKTIKDAQYRNRRIRFSLIFSSFLGLSFVMGYQMRMMGMTTGGIKGKLLILIVSGGIGVAFAPIMNCWFRFMDSIKANRNNEKPHFSHKTYVKIFWLSFVAIFLCWIPAFLAYYPAIMSYDFNRQSQEAYRGWIWFNTHHPLIHTALIRFFFLLGEQIGSYQIAMALFSLLQMLILSAVFAYSCNMIGRLTGKKWPVIVTAAVFALLPIHPVMALSMTKDVLFTAFFLLFLLLILERRLCENKIHKHLLSIALILTGMLVILFRNNAIYALIIFAVFYVLWSQKERIQIALICLLLIVGGQTVKNTIQDAMDAGSGSKMEMYSVFVQQMCRAAINHEAFLTPEESNMINTYIPYEFWYDYNPAISDSIKSSIAVYTFPNWKDDIPGMLIDWAKLGLHYPNDYLDAFLALTSGYWFLDDVSHAEVLGYGEDSNFGLIYTFNASTSEAFEGIENTSFLPGLLEWYQKIVNGNCYYNWPVLALLFKPAFYCWMLLLAMTSIWYLKERDKQILCLLPFIYLLTLLLGPVVNIRYAYPIIVLIPFLTTWICTDVRWTAISVSQEDDFVEANDIGTVLERKAM